MMIESAECIKTLLEDYLKNYNKELIQGTQSDEYPPESFLFKEFNNSTPQTINALKKEVTDKALRNEIIQYYKRELSLKYHLIPKNSEEELRERAIYEFSQLDPDDKLKNPPSVLQDRDIPELLRKFLSEKKYQYYHLERALQELEQFPLNDWLLKNCNTFLYQFQGNFRMRAYLYYAFINFHYSDRYNRDVSVLRTIYEDQLDRYDLIPINNGRELLYPRCIYDKHLNRTFLIKNIPFSLCRILMETKGINKLSVRLINCMGMEEKIRQQQKPKCYEAFEKGNPFDRSALGKFSVAKLYSAELYQNQLWVVIKDDNSITFEELYSYPDSTCDNIITQVIHCEYTKDDNDDCYIRHLDHEYIFYTKEEYNTRMRDHNQKGTSSKRMKNFKIDDSKIELTSQFLYDVLACYFRHTELLHEYFQNVST